MQRYRITVEDLPEGAAGRTIERRSVQFEVRNHDDLFQIVEAVQSRAILDRDKSAALAIGLKIFSEVMLEKRGDPLFAPLSEPIRNFIQQRKALPPDGLVTAKSEKTE